uniref:Putative secreted peptide n=1 Tax=Anopheles braziliensis TaxID=58242 RepID=A0A2M3ZSH4_9DIPT
MLVLVGTAVVGIRVASASTEVAAHITNRTRGRLPVTPLCGHLTGTITTKAELLYQWLLDENVVHFSPIQHIQRFIATGREDLSRWAFAYPGWCFLSYF